MRSIVNDTILKINSFGTIDELHNYIKYDINLDEFTYDEFLIIWKQMNLMKY